MALQIDRLALWKEKPCRAEADPRLLWAAQWKPPARHRDWGFLGLLRARKGVKCRERLCVTPIEALTTEGCALTHSLFRSRPSPVHNSSNRSGQALCRTVAAPVRSDPGESEPLRHLPRSTGQIRRRRRWLREWVSALWAGACVTDRRGSGFSLPLSYCYCHSFDHKHLRRAVAGILIRLRTDQKKGIISDFLCVKARITKMPRLWGILKRSFK